MTDAIILALISAAAGLGGVAVGGWLQIRAERSRAQRDLVARTLENMGRLVDATTGLVGEMATLREARRISAGAEQTGRIVEEIKRLEAEHSPLLHRQMTLSTQIREEVARKASMQLATDISELVMRSHDPIRIVETDADRAARLTMVEEIDARIGARFAMLVHRLGELARGDAPTTD